MYTFYTFNANLKNEKEPSTKKFSWLMVLLFLLKNSHRLEKL